MCSGSPPAAVYVGEVSSPTALPYVQLRFINVLHRNCLAILDREWFAKLPLPWRQTLHNGAKILEIFGYVLTRRCRFYLVFPFVCSAFSLVTRSRRARCGAVLQQQWIFPSSRDPFSGGDRIAVSAFGVGVDWRRFPDRWGPRFAASSTLTTEQRTRASLPARPLIQVTRCRGILRDRDRVSRVRCDRFSTPKCQPRFQRINYSTPISLILIWEMFLQLNQIATTTA